MFPHSYIKSVVLAVQIHLSVNTRQRKHEAATQAKKILKWRACCRVISCAMPQCSFSVLCLLQTSCSLYYLLKWIVHVPQQPCAHHKILAFLNLSWLTKYQHIVKKHTTATMKCLMQPSGSVFSVGLDSWIIKVLCLCITALHYPALNQINALASLSTSPAKGQSLRR